MDQRSRAPEVVEAVQAVRGAHGCHERAEGRAVDAAGVEHTHAAGCVSSGPRAGLTRERGAHSSNSCSTSSSSAAARARVSGAGASARLAQKANAPRCARAPQPQAQPRTLLAQRKHVEVPAVSSFESNAIPLLFLRWRCDRQ